MLPENDLFRSRSGFRYADRHRVNATVDYERGPLSVGTEYSDEFQTWSCFVEGNQIVIEGETNGARLALFSVNGEVSNVALAFNQNGQPFVCWTEDGVTRYYSDLSGTYQTYELGTGFITPRCTLDYVYDSNISDILLFYVRDGAVYYRQQRDRFDIEIATGIQGNAIRFVGLNVQYQVQISMQPSTMPQIVDPEQEQ